MVSERSKQLSDGSISSSFDLLLGSTHVQVLVQDCKKIIMHPEMIKKINFLI